MSTGTSFGQQMLPAAPSGCPQLCRCEGRLLYCEALNLTEAPHNLSGLLGLSLRHNRLPELRAGQFTGLMQLTWLYLDHNHICSVQGDAFQKLRRVKELTLSSNQITQLANTTFRPMPNLRSVDLSYNKLQALAPDLFHGLRKLTALHMRANAIQFVPVRIFQDCRSLKFLDIGYNQLKSLARNSFAGLFKLTELHLEHNDLVKVNFAHFPRLVSLHSLCLRRNKVAIVVSSLDWVWNLEKMDLSGNEIEYMEPHVFETVPHLQSLQLDSNRLTRRARRERCADPQASLRQLRQCFVTQRRKQKQKQTMHQMAAMSAQEYYVDYKPNHIEGALVIINEYGSCTCHQQPARECEV
ncbi:leucine-rich repeat transmembrane neuronal protein 1-like protein [Camelus ferus]|nr:leucine-rich repeat transmembrane neuronal protein 1-like protein [Camelus ferus]